MNLWVSKIEEIWRSLFKLILSNRLMEHITSHLHIPEKIMNPPSHSDSSPAADSSWASSVPVQIPKLELDQGSISQAANNEDQSHKDPEKKVMKKHKFSEVQKKPSN